MLERPLFRVTVLLIWLMVLAYASLGSPPEDEALRDALVRGSFTGRFAGVDPSVAAVFSSLGVIPLLMASLLVPDGRGRRPPAWPFALLAFALGAFAIAPYLVLRKPGGSPDATRLAGLVRILRSRGLALFILAALVALAAWGLGAGSGAAYVHAFRTARLVHMMTIDLCLCAALLPILVAHAQRTERVTKSPWLDCVVWLPVLGPALWNVLVRRSDP
jgi:cytochrome bd-type quinol oxidase subunit 2